MRNFERIKNCETPEEITYVFEKLKSIAIYANGRLLNSTPDNFMEWLNKESDDLDKEIFNMRLKKCPRCGSLPALQEYVDGTFLYHCYGCGFNRYDYDKVPRSELAARLQWNI